MTHDISIIGMWDQNLSYFTLCTCGWKQTTSPARGLAGAGFDADNHLREAFRAVMTASEAKAAEWAASL